MSTAGSKLQPVPPSGWPGHDLSMSSPQSTSPPSSAVASLTPTSSNGSSDHSATPWTSTTAKDFTIFPGARSSSLSRAMGQNPSRSHIPLSEPEAAPKGAVFGNVASATGSKLRRVFATRRKQSEDNSQKFFNSGKGKERERIQGTSPTSLSFLSANEAAQVTLPLSRSRRGPKELTLQWASQALTGGGGRKLTKAQRQSLSPPPPLPPKPAAVQAGRTSPPSPVDPSQFAGDSREPVIPTGHELYPAMDNMRLSVEQKERETERAVALEKEMERDSEKANADKDISRETWRKSDSTMSHHTIRPGATVGSRTPRPVSIAESLQSIHTIVPVNKGLNSLAVGEAGMFEEDDSSKSTEEDRTSHEQKVSPHTSLATKNRRSLSLNLGSTIYEKPQTTPSTPASAAELKYSSKSISEGAPISSPTSRDTPTLTRAAANGFISPTSTDVQSTGSNIRGHLAAWTTTTGNSQQFVQSSPHQRNLFENPPSHTSRGPTFTSGQSQPSQSLRQTAISITSGFAPAAGLAKRAVEKMGRAWGGISSSSGNSSSGYSSPSSSTTPSSYSSASHLDRILGSTSSVGIPSGKSKARRTPNAPSGSWSVNSSGTSSSVSDSEAFSTPSGPVLGPCIRGPMRTKTGGAGVAGGVVFGRDLRIVVKETAIQVGKANMDVDAIVRKSDHPRRGSINKNLLVDLEDRSLPALVVRSAQHVLIWGLQEEGLFRVNGRPSHVAKLKSEFDTGADFNMMECDPSQLDPHAVASIFKTFLREMPEPVLTRRLAPFFDAVVSAESNSNLQGNTESPRLGGRGPTLPSGPRSGLPAIRKPPSLTTLAVPNLTGMRPPSDSLLNAIRSLLAQLPRENRDLLRTVTDLVKATAKESKQTKMPLSNLLLVFCPSLGMSPPLLRVLCEGKDIWEESSPNSPVLDIKRESIIFDIGPTPDPIDGGHDQGEAEQEAAEADDGDEQFSDAMDGTEPEHQGSEELNHSGSDEELPEGNVAQPRLSRERRAPVATIYLDSESGPEDSSLCQVVANSNARTPAGLSAETTSLQDDVSYVSTSEGNSMTSTASRPDAPSPPLSSSAESLPTPPTSSGKPSLFHLPLGDEPYTKATALGAPVIADSTALPLSTRPRPMISGPIGGPIQFPFSTTPSPTTTPSFAEWAIPTLSLPNIADSHSPSSANSSPRVRRLKKPSLHLLFSKRSISPLPSPSTHLISGPYLQPPRASSDSSVSTPVSAVTASQSSPSMLPPRLDTPIETSSLQIELGLDEEKNTQPLTIHKKSHNEARVDIKADLVENTPLTLKPGETPIADRFYSASSSALSLTAPPNTRLSPSSTVLPTLRSSQSKASITSSASSNRLELLADDRIEDGWTQSVLMAADVDGDWNMRKTN